MYMTDVYLWITAHHVNQAAAAALRTATHVICTAAPNEDQGDPFLSSLGHLLPQIAGQVLWTGYLSTTGVYGNQDGGTVDETSPAAPGSKRGKLRVAAENAWAATGVWRLPAELHPTKLLPQSSRVGCAALPVHIFRLPGIYGPGRGPLDKARESGGTRIRKVQC